MAKEKKTDEIEIIEVGSDKQTYFFPKTEQVKSKI
jgi:hypothetical protein